MRQMRSKKCGFGTIYLFVNITFLFSLVGCATSKPSIRGLPEQVQVALDLIDQEHFVEAEQYIRENRADGYGYGYNRFQILAGTQKCIPELRKCEKVTSNLESVKLCNNKLQRVCDSTDLSPKWKKVSEDEKVRLENLEKTITEQEEYRVMSSRCQGTWGWGYVIGVNAWYPRPNSKVFASEADCEKKRETDPKASKEFECGEFCSGKFDSGPICKGTTVWQYYVGIHLMHTENSSYDEPNSKESYKSKKLCEQAKLKDKKAVTSLSCEATCDGEWETIR